MNDYIVTIGNDKFSVEILRTDLVKLNGHERKIEISKLSDFTYQIQLGNEIYHVTTTKLDNGKYSFLIDGHYFESLVRTSLEEKATEILSSTDSEVGELNIFSPMPGLILRLDKKIGEKVYKGEPIVLLEAMKMENELRSPREGIITEIYVKEGLSVEKNQKILSIK